MIVVAGGAGITMKVKMIPQEEVYETPHMGGDSFDYNTLNVSEKQAQGDEITVANSSGAFNIACLLADMGCEVALATIVSDDAMGMAVKEQLKMKGVDASYVKVAEGSTPVTISIMNILNDPQMVFGNAKLNDEITIKVADEWEELFNAAEAIVLDGNLPGETLKHIIGKYSSDSKKIFFDPSNYEGAVKSRDALEGLYCVMPGRTEAEAMLKRSVLSADELMQAGELFAEKGVAKSVITIKGGGLYYKDGVNEGILAPDRVLSFVGTSGAGDVVSAALIKADNDGASMEEAGRFAMKKAAEFLEGMRDERIIDTVNK